MENQEKEKVKPAVNTELIKRIIGIVLGVLFVVLSQTLEVPEGLTRQSLTLLFIALLIIDMWVLEVTPPAVAGLFVMVLMPILGCNTLAESFAGFGCTMVFMVIASSALAVILMKSSIPNRSIKAALRWAKGSSKKFVFAFMVITALFSTVVSNTPIALCFLGIAKVFLREYGIEPGKTNLGKCLMIGICGSAMIGGMGTPVGTAINLLGISALESTTGVTITFAQWMAVGIPCMIFTELAFFFGVTTFIKPEPIPETTVEKVNTELAADGKFNSYDGKTVFFIVALLVLWILGSFVPFLPSVTVAIIAVFIMFLPGVNMMNWKEFCDTIPWQVVCTFGAVNVFIGPFVASGAAQWIADIFINLTGGMGALGLCFLFAFIVVGLNAIFPLGTACVGMFGAPLCLIALASGNIDPAAMIFIVSLGSGCTFMIPFSLVYLLTYPDDGYFTIGDCARTGWFPTIAMAIIIAIVSFIVTPLLF